MAFVAVEDPTQPVTSPIIGMFAVPQNNPAPEGYIGEIDDSNARIATYIASLPS